MVTIFLLQWGEFRYYVAGHDVTRSYEGTVTLVPPSGILVGSSFLLSNEDWTIVGNKKEMYATYENYSRGKLLNRYILGVEDKIDVVTSGASDSSLWYFQAPSKFYGNNGIAYGGTLSFKIGSFSGDFSKLNDDEVSSTTAFTVVIEEYVILYELYS